MSNFPSSSQGGDGDQDDNPDFQSFHDQLRAIQGRIEKTAVVGESLQSTEHELQLHLQALSARTKDAYDAAEDEKASELKKRIANLSRDADELTKESNLLSRRTGSGPNSDMVCFYFLFVIFFSNHLVAIWRLPC